MKKRQRGNSRWWLISLVNPFAFAVQGSITFILFWARPAGAS